MGVLGVDGGFLRVGSYAGIYGVFCRGMGYVTIFATQVVTSVAKDCFRVVWLEAEILGGRVWWTKKTPENRVSCLASWPFGVHGRLIFFGVP